MKATDMVGISRLVIGRRERAVMLEARDKGIVLWTLRYGDEVRDEKNYFDSAPKEKADPKLMPLVGQLIKAQAKPWSPDMVGDPVQAKLLDIIAEKKKAMKKPKAAPRAKAEPVATKGNVVNIMDVLRKSLEGQGRKKAS